MFQTDRQKKIYIFADSAICCAGNTQDASLQHEIGKNEKSSHLFTSVSFSEKTFLAGCIPDTKLLKNTADNPKTRFETIADTVLYPLEQHIQRVISLYGSERVGICLGSCDNGSEKSIAAHKTFFSGGAFPADYKIAVQSPSDAAAYIAEKTHAAGPVVAVATACASSATAVIEAAELIKSGICDAVITGGIDIASQTVLLGFNALEAVSPAGCNPFSKNRNGITIGEAAAFFIIAKDKPDSEHYVQLLGYGESADANHMTAPMESGEGAAQAMRVALYSANLTAKDISYINLHGTGTELNDAMESRAVASVFAEQPDVPVSSTKAVTGHTLGAAGALELSICMRTMYDSAAAGQLPVHRWDGIQDPSIPALHLVKQGERITHPAVCMSNSFAFGGCNVSLIIGRDL